MKTKLSTPLIPFLFSIFLWSCQSSDSKLQQSSLRENTAQTTYCNPLDIDYTYMVYNSARNLSYRSGADPAVISFKGAYYMFVTRSFGYWYSEDLLHWEFIKPQQWFFEGSNAPTAFNYKDSLVYFAGNPAGYGSILYSDNPKEGLWKPVASISRNIQDSELFIDEDGSAYLYWGSSNVHPIRVKQLDKEDRFLELGAPMDLINLDEEAHGWERFGENNFHPRLKEGYMEGASMIKHQGKYYLQYAAPGTQFNVYADGVYVGDSPTGPFRYQKSNPMSFKPGGFSNGAGHGMTMKQTNGQYWHFATAALASNAQWERRIHMYPTYFDAVGLMYSNTDYGDYPRFGPQHPTMAGLHNGWMLLSYKAEARLSSSKLQMLKFTANDNEVMEEELELKRNASGQIISEVLTDENPKSYWVAQNNNDQEWVQLAMKSPGTVHAIQLNFHDHEAGIYTRVEGLKHLFVLEVSTDGQEWETVVDRSKSAKDSPNAYIELSKPVEAQFVRYKNISVPGTHLALSEIRVFGLGRGSAPASPKGFTPNRQEDRRDIALSWEAVKGAQGYNIRWGIAPDKMYFSWLVYERDTHFMRSLDKDTSYYFSIEAFNENGISEKSPIQFVE